MITLSIVKHLEYLAWSLSVRGKVVEHRTKKWSKPRGFESTEEFAEFATEAFKLSALYLERNMKTIKGIETLHIETTSQKIESWVSDFRIAPQYHEICTRLFQAFNQLPLAVTCTYKKNANGTEARLYAKDEFLAKPETEMARFVDMF